ncbi:hypothetical protein X474_00265 [Dethiosulfatarculus sandiegensis]|uniref:Uncharacterized protein n=1 Tax=Dethiosulfatarculus sandiegensis TaxID=1429043 RepID=A0A0D2JCY5_9BACT|nr:hypothetical protein X474_00265 [Dethiosulfatarculus sandiegensis]
MFFNQQVARAAVLPWPTLITYSPLHTIFPVNGRLLSLGRKKNNLQCTATPHSLASSRPATK